MCGQRRIFFPHWNLSPLNGLASSVRVWGSHYKRGRAAVLGVSNTHLKKSSARRLAEAGVLSGSYKPTHAFGICLYNLEEACLYPGVRLCQQVMKVKWSALANLETTSCTLLHAAVATANRKPQCGRTHTRNVRLAAVSPVCLVGCVNCHAFRCSTLARGLGPCPYD